jgi:hypothetical protein
MDVVCTAEECQLLQRATAAARSQVSSDGTWSCSAVCGSAGQCSSKPGQDITGRPCVNHL